MFGADSLNEARSANHHVVVSCFRPAPALKLSMPEREVAMLVAQGYTNQRIAAQLVVTEATAAKHVEHILDKLGFNSRVQIAAWQVGATRKSPAS